MKFLHTSDWHLGKSLHSHDLAPAQQAALDAIVDLAVEREVDAFVMAGDVFDRAFPSVDDVRRLNQAFTRIHLAGIPIICIAGNHDEGARLAAFTDLLESSVTVVGEMRQVGTAVALADEHGPVVFYPLPYLDPDAARRALAPDDGPLLERTHEAVVAEAMRRVRADLAVRRETDPSTRAVVVAHAFVVTGRETSGDLRAEQSDSERDIAVGGVPSVPTGVFDGVHYVALGHLHGPRTVRESDPCIRYSGSLLRYSISETAHEKSVTLVEIDRDGRCTVELVPVPQPAGMARLRGTLTELLSDAYASHHDDFVELLITDERLPDNLFAQLSAKFTRIMYAGPERAGSPSSGAAESGRSSLQLPTPLETLRNFYLASRDTELTEAMERILVDALERAGKDVHG